MDRAEHAYPTYYSRQYWEATAVAAGIVWIEQFFKYDAVGKGGIGGDDFAYQLVALTDTGVKLVAEVVLAAFLRHSASTSFCARLCAFPVIGILLSLTVSACSRLLRWTDA